jgi:quinoprotein glucose dehydrogenase
MVRRSRHRSVAALAASLTLCALPVLSSSAVREGEWREYAGDSGGQKYSSLSQINAGNIKDVQIAWTWPSPDREIQASDPLMRSTRNEDTPLMVNDALYTITPLGMVAALDPGTGKTRWVYDPQVYKNGRPGNSGFIHRGLAYWSDGKAERILASTNDAYLISIDAKTGVPDPLFGDHGRVDLTTGIRLAVRSKNFMGRRPVIAGNIAVVGNSIQDVTPTKEMPPGDVKAFDIKSGKLLWSFHTVPHPGEFGYDTWFDGSADYSGNTNVWTGMSYDPELDYVYLPVSGATHNTYGGHRHGDNLFAESLVCVEAKTGKRVWHFQLTHHGLWDYDISSQPVLGDITVNGRRVKAVMQVGKQGFAYVFDRKTGKPVWPIEERPVPQTTVPREWTAKTQPFPTKPPAFSLQGTTEENVIDFTPALRRQALEQLQNFQYGPFYTPPSEKGTIILPGYQGGANWGGGAFDPETGMFYVPSRLQSDVLRLAPGNPARSNFFYDSGGTGGPNLTALQRIEGLYIFKPPYSKVTAIDMNKGEIAWTSAIGNGPRRHPLLKDLNVGPLGDEVRTMGVLLTKTLLFVNVQRLDGGGRHTPPPWEQWGDADMWSRILYVFDKKTGQELRVFHLDGETAAPPATYLYRGKQYIVTAVGAGETSGLVALSLPDGGAATVASRTDGQPGARAAAAAASNAQGFYTREQAGRGAMLYQANCALCHMPDLSGGGFAPALSADAFGARWKGERVGDLFTIAKGTMPPDAPKSLKDEEYAAIVAYLLSMNGYPDGQAELSTDTAKLQQLSFK